MSLCGLSDKSDIQPTVVDSHPEPTQCQPLGPDVEASKLSQWRNRGKSTVESIMSDFKYIEVAGT